MEAMPTGQPSTPFERRKRKPRPVEPLIVDTEGVTVQTEEPKSVPVPDHMSIEVARPTDPKEEKRRKVKEALQELAKDRESEKGKLAAKMLEFQELAEEMEANQGILPKEKSERLEQLRKEIEETNIRLELNGHVEAHLLSSGEMSKVETPAVVQSAARVAPVQESPRSGKKPARTGIGGAVVGLGLYGAGSLIGKIFSHAYRFITNPKKYLKELDAKIDRLEDPAPKGKGGAE
jgi:hypothetical protein